MLTPTNFIAPLVLSVVVLFGFAALGIYAVAVKRKWISESTEFFLTAKNSQPFYRIAWGLFCCSIGAGMIFSVPAFVVHPVFGGGSLGLAMYTLFVGLPLLLVACMGNYIRRRFPEAISIGSFARWRYGPVFQGWVTLHVLLNLSVSLMVEYTAIGALANDFLGIPRWVPIVVTGTITIIYTSLGGLFISIITDQIQAIFIFLLLGVVAIFVGVNFRIDTLGPLPDYLGVNYVGWSSIATLGIALISATVFSDAVWQRVWAAKDSKALYAGAACGAALNMTVTFLIGFGGFIAAWAGLVTEENVNTAFFELLKVGTGAERVVPIGILAVLLLIAFVMNESAIDSFQIAIGDTLVSLFQSLGLDIDIKTARIILVLLNIPYAIVGLFNLNVIGLYLITNLLTTCVVVPLSLGMIEQLDTFITETSAMVGSACALIALIAYAIINNAVKYGYVDGAIAWEGLVMTFYMVYDWPPFLIAVLVSSGCTLAVSTGQHYYYKLQGLERPVPAHVAKQFVASSSSNTLQEDESPKPIIAVVSNS
jgi:Na+/proline symporter